MLSQDTRAFVEIFEVPLKDRRADRRRRQARTIEIDVLRARRDVRLFEEVLEAMEREAASTDPAAEESPSPAGGRSPTERELREVRAKLEQARAKAVEKTARARAVWRELAEQETRERRTRWYRLHTENEHVEWSEGKFARLAGAQRAVPVRVATKGGVRWWWYLDRFWFEDEGLSAEQVHARVLEDERRRLLRRRAQQRALEDIFAPPSSASERVAPSEAPARPGAAEAELAPEPAEPEPAEPEPAEPERSVPAAVAPAHVAPAPGGPALPGTARRVEARCVDCGSDVDVVFDAVPGPGGRGAGPIVELRCVSCRSRRQAAEPPVARRARTRRRQRPVQRDQHVAATDELRPVADDPRASGATLPAVWVVSPDEVQARSSS
jgi:hypothetical protein